MVRYELAQADVASYLENHNVLSTHDNVEVRMLGGGVSNVVLQVVTANDCLVVKQPLPNLDVDDDWPAHPDRVHNEAEAARMYGRIIKFEGLSGISVPEVVFESTSDNVIAITCAPESTIMWKRELLDGQIDPSVAELLGEFLGRSHKSAASEESLHQKFSSKAPFEQLRIDPYHRTVAERHPDVAPFISTEISRIKDVERTLVHGDFSPKNVLVDRSNGSTTVWILDFEVAHWGDPSFDTAFMLNHLLIKSVYQNTKQDAYIDAALRFWNTYTGQVDWSIERPTIRELAVLMLARVDGKSPVEYVNSPETKGKLRSTAKRAVSNDVDTIEEYISVLKDVTRP